MGAGSTPLSPPSVSISDNYLDNGFQAGVTEVYLAVKQNGPSLNFPVNLVGGMAAPNFGVSGIARDLGPVGGDLTNLLAGKFDPSDFFGNLSGTAGKLLGAISIIDIIQAVDPDEAGRQRPGPPDLEQFRLPQQRRHPAPDGHRHQAQLEPDGAGRLARVLPAQQLGA